MNGALVWAVSMLTICGAQFIIQQETCNGGRGGVRCWTLTWSSGRSCCRMGRRGGSRPPVRTEGEDLEDLCRVEIALNKTIYQDCRNQLWEHRKLINLTITPCDKDPCIYRKDATYEISFYAVANYSQKFLPWWDKGLSYVNEGKLMGGIWLEQHTEDLRAFGEEVPFNFINPDVDMPLRVKRNETFKITARLCRKFYPYDFTLKIYVGTWQYSFGCAEARVNVTREWKKCLNYDDSEQPTSTEKPRIRAEL